MVELQKKKNTIKNVIKTVQDFVVCQNLYVWPEGANNNNKASSIYVKQVSVTGQESD